MVQDIFCTMLSTWRDQGKILSENDSAYSILSVTPAVPGHFIVISKRHVVSEIDLTGDEWVDLFKIVKESLKILSEMDIVELKNFYEDLKQNPPVPISVEFAGKMLTHPYLGKEILGYNLGVNVGKETGQLIEHFHIQVFPIRKPSKGIVSAIREFHESK